MKAMRVFRTRFGWGWVARVNGATSLEEGFTDWAQAQAAAWAWVARAEHGERVMAAREQPPQEEGART